MASVVPFQLKTKRLKAASGYSEHQLILAVLPVSVCVSGCVISDWEGKGPMSSLL